MEERIIRKIAKNGTDLIVTIPRRQQTLKAGDYVELIKV